MKSRTRNVMLTVAMIAAGLAAALAFGAWGGGDVTTVTVTTATAGPAGPAGPPGPAGANGMDGATGPMGPAGLAGKSADLCPNWDGVQQRPPRHTVSTLNPRGQFVCVALWRAKAWHTK